MTKTKRPMTDQEREQRRAQPRELTRAAIEQLRSSDGWLSYLKARFGSYSPRSILMIRHQHPSAERVAGFRAWLELSFRPARGSKAIRIWAPCPPSKRQLQAWRDADSGPDEKPPTGWHLASVFVQDQVAELPPPARPLPLEPPIAEIRGDSHKDRIGELVTLAGEIGYAVTFGDTGPADETCNPKTKRIAVAERLEANGRLVALIQELAHALVAIEPDARPYSITRNGG